MGSNANSSGLVMVYIPHLRMGGGETSMLRVAAGLQLGGMPVCVVTHTLQTCELTLPPDLEVVALDCHGTARAWWRLVQLLRQRKPRCLLSAFPHSNIAAVAAATVAGTRCVVTEHAPLSRQIAQQDNWRYRLLPLLVRLAYRRANAVVAVSEGVRTDLQQMLGAAVQPQVIANPVLPPGYEEDLRTGTGHPWAQDPALEVVLSLGRLSVEKDLRTLIAAFAQVHAQRPQTRLIVVGDGPERERLAEQVLELDLLGVIHFAGRTTTPLRWMHEARVFVLASQYEGFGNVLVEALAAGASVVSTDCPVGPREILAHGQWGQLVPVGDAAQMAQAIVRALQQGQAPQGAREAAQQYTQENACKRYRALIEGL